MRDVLTIEEVKEIRSTITEEMSAMLADLAIAKENEITVLKQRLVSVENEAYARIASACETEAVRYQDRRVRQSLMDVATAIRELSSSVIQP